MKYIDLHAHMVSRTTDDYEQMALTGCVALTEPAFWAGFDHLSPVVFANYFNRLTSFEPTRAAKYGIQHYCWLCLNPKEGEDRELARHVLDLIPRFLDRPNVLGIGEIGVNRVTRNEIATFIDHVDLALRYNQLIHIHTPHLEDKYKGTKVIVDTLVDNRRIEPGRVMVDHAEEHTIGMILDRGFWRGGGWDGAPSRPTAIPHFVLEMRRRGHSDRLIHKVVYENPIEFLSQSPKFRLTGESAESRW